MTPEGPLQVKAMLGRPPSASVAVAAQLTVLSLKGDPGEMLTEVTTGSEFSTTTVSESELDPPRESVTVAVHWITSPGQSVPLTTV